MQAAPSAAAQRPPSLALWLREATAFAEFGAALATLPWWRLAPRGQGHPVLVLPGLVQTDGATRLLRWFLSRRGHDVHAARMGLNTGRTRRVDELLLPRLLALHEKTGRPVSLVGWSMGGLYARELALRAPASVRQVITLGSPFTGDAKASNAWRLYQVLSGERAGDPGIARRFRGPLPVPTTALYSRVDGIVAWPCCVNDLATAADAGAPAENVEVRSSHLGLGHHPAVLYALADRLAQPAEVDADRWRPFAPPPALRWMYPSCTATSPRQTPKEQDHEPEPIAEPRRAHGAGHRRIARARPADGRGAG